MRRWTTALVVGLVLGTTPGLAQRATPPARRSLSELTAEVVRTTQAYRDAVARSIPQHEASVREAVATLEEGRKLHKAGALPAAYVEQAERDLAAAERELEEAQKALDDADRLLFEAALQQRLDALPALPRGGFEDRAMLPISAFGQTKVHDRLGLDHRTAIDVAVSPDSAEGQWLMTELRAAGIPFIGIRGVVPGASSGHVHIGPESARLMVR